MIKVVKSNRIPNALKKCDSKIAKALIEKGKHNFVGYNDKGKEVQSKLFKIYNTKCAYCERNTDDVVEHYRPKAKVTDEPSHEGYYWLGYEWTNLLLACSRCNRKKANRFPLASNGIRIFTPPLLKGIVDKKKCKANYKDLLNEKPLLLNPEDENFNPELHFVISPNGTMKGISEQGEKTIEICDLNGKILITARKKIVEECLKSFLRRFNSYSKSRIDKKALEDSIREEIVKIADRICKKEEYTFVAKCMLIHFDKFFSQRFQSEQRKILQSVYQQTISNIQTI